jgi:hypothetical protein
MSTLVIKDLAASKDLDKAAAMKIRGGLINTNSLFVARPDEQSFSAAKLPGNIYNIVTNKFNYVNPTIFNVYNGDGNSGTIINSFNTLSLNAASPTLAS